MTLVSQDINIVDDFVQFFKDNKNVLEKGSPDFINKIRPGALSFFKDKGIPGKKDENYKYTNIQPLLEKNFSKYVQSPDIRFAIDEIFKCDVPELDTHVILLVNGHYSEKNQPEAPLPEDITIGSFREISIEKPGLIEPHFNHIADYTKDSMVALNTAFTTDGIFMHVPRGITLQKPIQIINLLLSEEDQFVQYRNLFVLEENSSADVVICDHSLVSKNFFTNTVTEIAVAENAKLEFTKMQNEHNDCTKLAHIFVNQKRNSLVNSNIITLNGGAVRNNLHVSLEGEGAENKSHGLFLTDKNQHVDSFTYVDHKVPNCTSTQLYKGILDDGSTGAFTGRIHVHPNAQKTIAYQRNSNLLLTDTAKMNTKPQLEIYADDVKCTHGATVGQLDEEAMFYLRSRGIARPEARLLLMFAFADEVTNTISILPLRERIDELVGKRLRGELTRCQNCAIHCRCG